MRQRQPQLAETQMGRLEAEWQPYVDWGCHGGFLRSRDGKLPGTVSNLNLCYVQPDTEYDFFAAGFRQSTMAQGSHTR